MTLYAKQFPLFLETLGQVFIYYQFSMLFQNKAITACVPDKLQSSINLHDQRQKKFSVSDVHCFTRLLLENSLHLYPRTYFANFWCKIYGLDMYLFTIPHMNKMNVQVILPMKGNSRYQTLNVDQNSCIRIHINNRKIRDNKIHI